MRIKEKRMKSFVSRANVLTQAKKQAEDWYFLMEKLWPEKDARRKKRMATVTFLILRPALVTGGRGCYMS